MAEGPAVNRARANGPCQATEVTGSIEPHEADHGASHAHKSYDGKVVLDDVTLAFLPGAKIGVAGPNGMGKSTLLRMMAGLEPPSNGEVRLMPGYSAGILPQEPVLDEGKTVLGNVEEGVAETKALIERYNEIAAKLPANDLDVETLASLVDALGEFPAAR